VIDQDWNAVSANVGDIQISQSEVDGKLSIVGDVAIMKLDGNLVSEFARLGWNIE
jgi:hypothetical protein